MIVAVRPFAKIEFKFFDKQRQLKPATKAKSDKLGGMIVPEATTPMLTTALVSVSTSASTDRVSPEQATVPFRRGKSLLILIGGKVSVLFTLIELLSSKRRRELNMLWSRRGHTTDAVQDRTEKAAVSETISPLGGGWYGRYIYARNGGA